MTDVTRILSALEQGDAHAADQLFPLVYEELRVLAAQLLARERPGQTLQATALVHEAYLRLVPAASSSSGHWTGRRHFFAAAAEAMRRILVDRARRKHAQKRGANRLRADLEDACLAAPQDSDEVLAVDEALEDLMAADPQACELVKLRYFVGLSLPEAAQILDISPRTADRLWAYARAWLRRAIEQR